MIQLELTEFERDIVAMVLFGLSPSAIAEEVGVDEADVKKAIFDTHKKVSSAEEVEEVAPKNVKPFLPISSTKTKVQDLPLTDRQKEILVLFLNHYSDTQISEKLGIQKGTVRRQISIICKTLNVESKYRHPKRSQLFRYCSTEKKQCPN